MPLPDPSSSSCIEDTIAQLIGEGYDADQAAAVAYDHCGSKNEDDMKRSLPKGAQHKTGSIADASVGEREAIFIASTDSVDRDGDIVEQNWDFKNFRKNPVLLFQHEAGKLPIGKVSRIWTDESITYAKAEGLPLGFDDFADKVWRFIKGGFLNAVSVGFLPTETPEVRYDKDGNWLGYRFPANELTELSVVSVPANQEALAIARSWGVGEPTMKRIFVQRSSQGVQASVASAAKRYAEIERMRAGI